MNFPGKQFFYAPKRPSLRPTYKLNRAKKCLEQTGEEDLQKMIDSYSGSALDAILDRFLYDGADLPEVDPESGWNVDVLADRLEEAGAMIDNLEEVRDTYDLPDTASYDDIRVFLDNRIKILQEEKEKKQNEKKKSSSQQSAAVPSNQQTSVPEGNPNPQS